MHEGINVLIVDDEEQFRVATRKILNKKGFDVILAADGEEALDMLDQAPDIVVLDIKMPGMDGHDVLREIKRRTPGLPVIMLTGHGKEPSAREALDLGAFDYLAKPCDVDLLSAKILEAYHFSTVDNPAEEKLVRDIMIPITDYTTISEDQDVADAVGKLWESFSTVSPTNGPLPARHLSIVVFDVEGRIKGILAILDLLKAIMPPYLSVSKPFPADAIQYSPMFWRGAFRREVDLLARRKVKEIMSPAPMAIEYDVNLMEAAYLMVTHQPRRMVVTRNGEVAGVLREQDLFFEIQRILEKKRG
jgi:CheY-like chemotaxis protein